MSWGVREFGEVLGLVLSFGGACWSLWAVRTISLQWPSSELQRYLIRSVMFPLMIFIVAPTCFFAPNVGILMFILMAIWEGILVHSSLSLMISFSGSSQTKRQLLEHAKGCIACCCNTGTIVGLKASVILFFLINVICCTSWPFHKVFDEQQRWIPYVVTDSLNALLLFSCMFTLYRAYVLLRKCLGEFKSRRRVAIAGTIVSATVITRMTIFWLWVGDDFGVFSEHLSSVSFIRPEEVADPIQLAVVVVAFALCLYSPLICCGLHKTHLCGKTRAMVESFATEEHSGFRNLVLAGAYTGTGHDSFASGAIPPENCFDQSFGDSSSGQRASSNSTGPAHYSMPAGSSLPPKRGTFEAIKLIVNFTDLGKDILTTFCCCCREKESDADPNVPPSELEGKDPCCSCFPWVVSRRALDNSTQRTHDLLGRCETDERQLLLGGKHSDSPMPPWGKHCEEDELPPMPEKPRVPSQEKRPPPPPLFHKPDSSRTPRATPPQLPPALSENAVRDSIDSDEEFFAGPATHTVADFASSHENSAVTVCKLAAMSPSDLKKQTPAPSIAPEWKDVAPAGKISLEYDDDREEKRGNMNRELYETEKTFGRGISLFFSHYWPVLKPQLQHFTTLVEMKLRKIQELNELLLRTMEEEIATCQSQTGSEAPYHDLKWGAALEKIFPRLHQYSDFINSYDPLTREVQELQDSGGGISQQMAAVRSELEGMPDINGYDCSATGILITPIQRLMRYKLFLQDLVQIAEGEEVQQLNMALSQIQCVAKFVNENRRLNEQRMKIQWIEEEFGLNGLKREGRELVKECQGELEAGRAGKKKLANCKLFLFNDILLCLKFRKGLTPGSAIRLPLSGLQCIPHSVQSDPRPAVEIIVGGFDLVIVFPDEFTHSQWTDTLQSTAKEFSLQHPAGTLSR